MPDAQGELNPQEYKKIQEWVRRQPVAASKCPISGDNNWEIGTHVVTPLRHGAGGSILGGPAYPQVMLICTNCGYTQYFNAMIIGLYDDSGGATDGEE